MVRQRPMMGLLREASIFILAVENPIICGKKPLEPYICILWGNKGRGGGEEISSEKGPKTWKRSTREKGPSQSLFRRTDLAFQAKSFGDLVDHRRSRSCKERRRTLRRSPQCPYAQAVESSACGSRRSPSVQLLCDSLRPKLKKSIFNN